MKTIRYIIAGICVSLVLVTIYFIDYHHFFSGANVSMFVVILVMILNILALMWPAKIGNSRQKQGEI